MSEISISILDCNFNDLETEFEKINSTDASFVHLDIMDGVFVPRDTRNTFDLEKIKELSNKKLDVHLMIDKPIKYLQRYIDLKPEYISVHLEKNSKLNECINKIQSNNIKAGVAINPDTDIKLLEPYIKQVDLILIMSVFPGEGGQKFLSSTFEKIKLLNQYKMKNNFKISVDGGVNNLNSEKLHSLYSDILVSGSFLVKNEDIKIAVKSLLNK